MIEFVVSQNSGAEAVYTYLTTTPITKPLQVVIKVFKRDRSKEQNALFHVWAAYISKQYYLTHGTHFAPKVWKEYFKKEFLGEETLEGPRGTMVRTRRTRDLSVPEMSEFMLRLTVYCLEEYNITLKGLED
ncbi:MAG: recombination protein NinB [Thiohalomonadales bacterium]